MGLALKRMGFRVKIKNAEEMGRRIEKNSYGVFISGYNKYIFF